MMAIQPDEMIALLNNYKSARAEDVSCLAKENTNIAGDALYEAIKEMMTDMMRDFQKRFNI